MKGLSIKAFVLGAALVVCTSAQAGLIRITPTGVASNQQLETSPVPIGADGFRLTYHSNGNQPDIINPLILIIGTPDGGPVPSVEDGPNQNPESLVVGPTPLALNFEGAWSGQNNNIYSWLGLNQAPGGASENYTNWTGALAEHGIDPIATWNIYTVELNFNPNLGTGDWNEFVTDLAAGSYVAGWGCTAIRKEVCSRGEATPFTFAGLVTVPEPGMLSLLGAGIVGLGLFGRRRRVQA